MDVDMPWPCAGCRSRFNGLGLSLSSIRPGIRRLRLPLLPHSVEGRTIAPLSGGRYFLYSLSFAPWIIWTKFVLQIPSDLITQNFSGGGTELAWTSPINFVWIRLQNLFHLIGSQMFSVYPFDARSFVNYMLVCLPGIIGFVTIYPALAQCIQLSTLRSWVWYGLVGPAGLILVVFSVPALPALHGYQPLLGVLLFVGALWLRQHSRSSHMLALSLFKSP